MHWRYIFYIIGILNLVFGFTMVFPLLWGVYYQDQSLLPLLKSMAITIGAGLAVALIFGRARAESLNQREGMAIVTIPSSRISTSRGLPA